MKIEELRKEAQKKKQGANFKQARELYKKLWEQEKRREDGYNLALCYRKTKRYDDARNILNIIQKLHPHFKLILSEKLWLDFYEKIKDGGNPNYISDAEKLLSQADKYDNHTGWVYTKTVLNVVRRLCNDGNYISAYKWLKKLDQSVIDNTVFIYQGQKFPADRKEYFMMFADVILNLDIHIDYIESYLSHLNFDGNKHTQFKRHIIEDISYDNPNSKVKISKVKLAKYIKHFQEEIHLRLKSDLKNIYSANKITLISDLSHYLFCPVSFAINETFSIEANTSWEKDERYGERKRLIDRYKIFKQTKSYEESFNDILIDKDIGINSKLIDDFDYIFNSTILVNNATSPKPTIYSSKHNTLKGAPDYLMEDSKGVIYAITEKFSSIHSVASKYYSDSDLIKHYAYLDEIEEINLSFGYFITWYWDSPNFDSSYRIMKIEKTELNSSKLKKTINSITEFKQNKSMKINGNIISNANKCFKCSVAAYCNHKTGKYDQIDLPYNLAEFKIDDEPKIEMRTMNIENNDEVEDLPF